MIGDYIPQPAWMAENKAGLFAPLTLTRLYTRADDWSGKAILNVAGSSKFSSDRYRRGASSRSHSD